MSSLLALDVERPDHADQSLRDAISSAGPRVSCSGSDLARDLPPGPVRDRAQKEIRDLLDGDLSVVEKAVLTKSGEERLIEWRNTLLRDDAGRVIGTFSSGTDITERSQAVAALRTAEERMRFALQSANVGIWDMDYTTGVLRWSEILEAQYGLPPGTFGGTFEAFIERVHPDDRAVRARDGRARPCSPGPISRSSTVRSGPTARCAG